MRRNKEPLEGWDLCWENSIWKNCFGSPGEGLSLCGSTGRSYVRWDFEVWKSSSPWHHPCSWSPATLLLSKQLFPWRCHADISHPVWRRWCTKVQAPVPVTSCGGGQQKESRQNWFDEGVASFKSLLGQSPYSMPAAVCIQRIPSLVDATVT